MGRWALSLVLHLIVAVAAVCSGQCANVQVVSSCELSTAKVLMSNNTFQKPEVTPASRTEFTSTYLPTSRRRKAKTSGQKQCPWAAKTSTLRNVAAALVQFLLWAALNSEIKRSQYVGVLSHLLTYTVTQLLQQLLCHWCGDLTLSLCGTGVWIQLLDFIPAWTGLWIRIRILKCWAKNNLENVACESMHPN